VSTVLKRFSLVGVAVALLAGGCGTGPGKAGSAAIVGGEAIDLKTVQDRTITVLKKEPDVQQMKEQGKLDQISRLVLSDEILHKIAEYAAQRENITVDQNKVYDTVEQAGGAVALSTQSINDPTNIHRAVHDSLVMAELARRNLSTLEVTIDYVQVKDPKEAKEMAEQVAADPAKMTEFVQAARRNTGGEQQSAADKKVRVTEYPSLAASPLWAAKPGTVVAFQLDPQASTSMVALVKEHTSLPPVPGEDNLADRVDPKVLFDFGKRIGQYVAADLPMEINPRYGVWDPIDTKVKAVSGEATGFMAPVAVKNKS
jgi:hypothetical protein